MNFAIVTDTTSAISQQEAQSMGIFVLPMPVTIDGRQYLEGIDLDPEFFFRKQAEGADITTSQPAPGAVTELWDEVLKNYDGVLYLPMSSGLSSSYNTACTLAEDYGGRVVVVDTKRVAPPLWQTIQDALLLQRRGLSMEEIRARLESQALACTIYITPPTLEFLKRGGRITPAAAAVGTVLNLKPVLQIQGGKVDAFARVRGMKQATQRMFTALEHDIATRFAGKPVRIFAAYSGTPDVGESWGEQMRARYGERFIRIDPLALNICCHTGPGALGLGCTEYEA